MTTGVVKVLFRAARALPSPLQGCIQSSGSSDFDRLTLCWNAVISSDLTAASVPSRNGLLESSPNDFVAAVAAWVEVVAGTFR